MMKALFALLQKLASWLIGYQHTLVTEADAKYAKASASLAQLQTDKAKHDADYAAAVAEILDLRTQNASYEQQLKDAKARIGTLENDLERTKNNIAVMPVDNVWDARLSPNATPPIIGGGSA